MRGPERGRSCGGQSCAWGFRQRSPRARPGPCVSWAPRSRAWVAVMKTCQKRPATRHRPRGRPLQRGPLLCAATARPVSTALRTRRAFSLCKEELPVFANFILMCLFSFPVAITVTDGRSAPGHTWRPVGRGRVLPAPCSAQRSPRPECQAGPRATLLSQKPRFPSLPLWGFR